MQLCFFSENMRTGQTASWPCVPRIGEPIEFNHTGGVQSYKVNEVTYHASADGSFHSITVYLDIDYCPGCFDYKDGPNTEQP